MLKIVDDSWMASDISDLQEPVRKGWLKPVRITKREIDKDGYVMIRVSNHFLVGSRRIAEHRLVLVEKLCRKLQPWEVAHHDLIRDRRCNHPENILLMKASEHAALHNREREISEFTRAKKSSSMKGNKNALGMRHTDEAKRKMKAARAGKKPMLGKRHTEDAKIKMSKTQKRIKNKPGIYVLEGGRWQMET